MSEEFKPVEKIEWTPDDKDFHKKIERLMPSADDKCAMIATLLGQSGVMADFIMRNHSDPFKIPLPLAYAVTLTAGNLIAFSMDDEKLKFVKMDVTDNKVSEQTLEHVFRKMKYIVETLHAHLNDLENELKL